MECIIYVGTARYRHKMAEKAAELGFTIKRAAGVPYKAVLADIELLFVEPKREKLQGYQCPTWVVEEHSVIDEATWDEIKLRVAIHENGLLVRTN